MLSPILRMACTLLGEAVRPEPSPTFNPTRYYRLLVSVSRRIPFASGPGGSNTGKTPVQMSFEWNENFSSGMFGSKKVSSVPPASGESLLSHSTAFRFCGYGACVINIDEGKRSRLSDGLTQSFPSANFSYNCFYANMVRTYELLEVHHLISFARSHL